jgi:hypothetical protein
MNNLDSRAFDLIRLLIEEEKKQSINLDQDKGVYDMIRQHPFFDGFNFKSFR